MAIPQLLTAADLSDHLKTHRIELSAERITELCETGHMPHYRCDNGPPLFRKQEAKDWILATLFTIHRGQPMPTSISIIDPETFGGVVRGVPIQLTAMSEWLREFPLGLLREGSCVYFLVKGDCVVYVGRSDGVAARLLQHFKDKEFDRALFFRVPREDAARVEVAFIKLLMPKYNSPTTQGGPPAGQLNEYSSRYMRAIGTDAGEPANEESARLLTVIDRINHDHNIARGEANRNRNRGMSLKLLLARVLDRLEAGGEYDKLDPADMELARDIRSGISYSFSLADIPEDADPDQPFWT